MSRIALFYSSIGKKFLVALTGLFLTFFLIIHLSGNLQLLLPESMGARLQFNEYTEFMTSFVFIKVASYITYISILLHAVLGLIFSVQKNKVRPQAYQYAGKHGQNSAWASRNMGVLGTLVLAFIILHLANFWYQYKFGTVPYQTLENGEKIKDMYEVVMTTFQNPIYVALYVLSMLAIGFHLWHGVQSGFQTLGMNHEKYTPMIKAVGAFVAVVIPALFAIIPITIYLIY